MDQYLRAQPEAVRPILERVRSAIRKALPKAEEGIAYNIPVYKLNGAAVFYFAGWKTHYVLYPARAALADAFREELAAYRVNNSMIRIPFSVPVPAKLIAQIAKFRAVEAAATNRSRRTKSKQRQIPQDPSA